jgi:hypothetical protein
MLKELIAQMFCREISRKLRRLGMLGAIVSIPLALYIELPLEISIATKEAEIAMAAVHHSIDQMLANWERHGLEMHRLHLQPAKRSN